MMALLFIAFILSVASLGLQNSIDCVTAGFPDYGTPGGYDRYW